MLLFLLALYFFRRTEEHATYENTLFMKKYLLENPHLMKKDKKTDQVKKSEQTTSV